MRLAKSEKEYWGEERKNLYGKENDPLHNLKRGWKDKG